MIKYAYAKADGNLLHIDDVTAQNRHLQRFTCVECGERMIAHISSKKKRHFKHFNQPQHNFETYLHKTAKELVYNSYIQAIQDNNPVLLEYNEEQLCNTHIEHHKKPCPYATIKKQYDLTQTYKAIVLEQRFDGLQPDLCLVSERFPPIYIEIFVTHECEPEKIKKGIRIIEIKIESEADLQKLYTLNFTLTDNRIKYYNFKTNTQISNYCVYRDKGCRKAFYFVDIIGNKTTHGITTYENILTQKASDGVNSIFARRCSNGKNYAYDEFKSMYDEIKQKGISIRSCTYCKYHERQHSYDYDTVYCSKMDYNISFERAERCTYYKAEK